MCGTPKIFPQGHNPVQHSIEITARQVERAGNVRDLVGDGFPVAHHYVGEDDAVGETMVRIVSCADGVRHRMDRAEPFLESRGSHRRRREHVGASFQVATVSDGAWQIGVDDLDALQRHAVGERMKGFHTIGLEAVRQRIHARRHGQKRRQADRELRVLDGDLRHHQGVKDDFLFVRVFAGDHAGAPDLRAGAGGGRHRDDGGDAVGVGPCPLVAGILEIKGRARLGHHERHALSDVECRATADRDNAVVTTLLKRHNTGRQVDSTGLPLTSEKMLIGISRLAHAPRDTRDHVGLGESLHP